MSAHSGRNKFSLCLSSAWIKNWQNWNKNLHERFYLNLWLTLGCVTILSRWQEQLVAVTSILVISKVVAKFQPQLLWLVLSWAREFYELRVPFYVASISEMGSLCNYRLRWSATSRLHDCSVVVSWVLFPKLWGENEFQFILAWRQLKEFYEQKIYS